MNTKHEQTAQKNAARIFIKEVTDDPGAILADYPGSSYESIKRYTYVADA